jgi:CPA2 family monovalent cation:H+ antiporter-2
LHDAHESLRSLTVVLAVAALVGPHVPVPLVADAATIQVRSELGVILLMYSLGLEFRLRKLVEVGPTAGLTALRESSLMVWLGFIVGRLFGWPILESPFAGAIIAISSTTIIARAFEEQGITGKLRELVVWARLSRGRSWPNRAAASRDRRRDRGREGAAQRDVGALLWTDGAVRGTALM